MKEYVVYIHKNKIDGKEYVGLTSLSPPTKRWQNGKGYKTQIKFYRAIEKYGWDNFEHIIVAQHLSAESASVLEQQLIKEHNTINKGYNVDEGGVITNHSEETKKKIGEANRRRKITPQMRANMSKGQMGNNNKGKAVLCVETGKVFKSAREAGRFMGKTHTMIASACRGERELAYGLHWRYI